MWSQRQTLRQPGETIVGFLTAWLGLHILGVDQAMTRQVRHIEAGFSGAEAHDLDTANGDQVTRALLKMVGKLHHVLAQQSDHLLRANQDLEARVEQRTHQLASANQALGQANAQLKAFGLTDALLQIPNRASVDERLRVEVARSAREQRALGLLMLDVDFFKRFNDRYGHPAGDACLQAVARATRGALARETDFIGRYGGEELLVLLPDTDAAGVAQVAQRLVDAVRALALPHAASDASAVVTVSVGACSGIPPAGDAGPSLLACADQALYEAKRSGRDRVVASALAPA
jgi:diguanylate cyclase (GGDEF)-like protein